MAAVALRLIHIGMGGWGRDWEVNAIPRVKEVDRVACVDSDEATLAPAQKSLKLPDALCFTSLDEALGGVAADAVLVTVPIDGHVPVSLAALDAGKHVLCEKPFSPTMDGALRVVDGAARRNLTLMVSQNYRFFPAVRKATELVQTNSLGPAGTVAVDFRRYANASVDRANRHYLMHHPLLFDMAIHHFDLMRMVLGQEPVEVYCKLTDPAWSHFAEDASASVIVTFAGGATVSYRGSWVSTGPQTAWAGDWRIECEQGEITFTSRNGESLAGDKVTTQAIGGEVTDVTLPKLPYTGRAGALATFAAAVATGQEPESSGRANLGSIALMYAAARSATSGKVESVNAAAVG